MKIKKTIGEIHQIKTFRDLLFFLPQDFYSRAAAFLLAIWSLVPLAVLARGSVLPRQDMFDEFLNLSTTIIFWTIFLTQVGLLGCGLGLLHVLRTLVANHRSGHPLSAPLKAGLPAVLLLALLIWSLFSFLISTDTLIGWNGTFYRNEGLRTYFLYAGVFCCGYIIHSQKRCSAVLNVLSASATVLSAVSVANIPAVNDRLLIDAQSSIFFNQNHFGYFLTLAMMIAVLLLMKETRGRLFLLYRTAVIVITAYALVANNSFGPFLAVCCGFLFLLICLKMKKTSRMARFWLASGIFLGVVLYVNLITRYVGSNVTSLARDLQLIIGDSENAGSAGSARWMLWTHGITFIAEKPLFGFGPDNLGNRYLELGIDIDRPHNILIQLAASLGIPALIFYLSALVILAIRFFRQLQTISLTTIGLAAAVVSYFISSLFGNSMFYTTPFYLLILGMLIGKISPLSADSDRTKASDTDPDPGHGPLWQSQTGRLPASEKTPGKPDPAL